MENFRIRRNLSLSGFLHEPYKSICLKTVPAMTNNAGGDVSTSMIARIGAIAVKYYIMQHDVYNPGVCLLEMEL